MSTTRILPEQSAGARITRMFGLSQLRRVVAGLLVLVALLGSILLVNVSLSQGWDTVQTQEPSASPLQSGYDLSWWTVDGGGGTWSSGGGYRLGATIGQPDAGDLSGGACNLCGGYWCGLETVLHRVYLPLVLRGY
jgi:hypothetical protein